MGSTMDDYDLFDGDRSGRPTAWPDRPEDTTPARRTGRPVRTSSTADGKPHRDTIYHAGIGSHVPGRAAARGALATGLLAIVCAAASAVHEAAPAFVDPDGRVPGRYIALVCAILIACTLVLIIAARVAARRGPRHHGVAGGGIVAMCLAMMLLAFAVVAGVLFPAGIVRPNMRDEAPVNSVEGMRFDLERVTGACPSGWADVPLDLPGVSDAAACTDTRVAYVTFDTDAAAGMYRGNIRDQVAAALRAYLGDAAAQEQWRLLNGTRWIAFGDENQMTAMQQEWGGSLEAVETGGEAD